MTSQKHEEGTFSFEGRVPGRVGGERKVTQRGPLPNRFDGERLPRDQSGGHTIWPGSHIC